MSRQEDRSRRVARYVVARRNDLGLSQRALAEQAGTNPKTVHSLESGKHWPQVETQQKIEPALGWAEGDIVRIAEGGFPSSGPVPEDDPDGLIAAAMSGGPEDELEARTREVIDGMPEEYRQFVLELYEQLQESERQKRRLLSRIALLPHRDDGPSSPGSPDGGVSSGPRALPRSP